MSAERRSRAATVMRLIQADVAADSARREGLPFTGATVSVALGELAAQIGAVAQAVELLLEDQP